MREAAQRDDEVTTMTHDRHFHQLINEASGTRGWPGTTIRCAT